MMPSPNFRTPKSFAFPGLPSPGTVGTVMPDSTGLEFYDGPAQISQRPLFTEVPVTVDENVNKPAKHARQVSTIPFRNMIITPNMEDINKQNVLEPVKQMDKTLWREKWEQCGKPESLEDFVRKQRLAILQSNIDTSPSKYIWTLHSHCKFLTGSYSGKRVQACPLSGKRASGKSQHGWY
jgi:hypothetical protein